MLPTRVLPCPSGPIIVKHQWPLGTYGCEAKSRQMRCFGAESSHDSGGSIWLHEKRTLKVCQTTYHTRGALVFGFNRCQAVWVSVTYRNRACSKYRFCFQRQFDLKLRATNGRKYPPGYRGMTLISSNLSAANATCRIMTHNSPPRDSAK